MRLCSGPGCGRKIADDVRYCDECKAERGLPVGDGVKQHTTAYTDELDEQRKTARWQRIRDKLLSRSPLCARCGLVFAQIMDHIVPAAVAVEQARASGVYPASPFAGYYLESNLQGLCRPCHGIKTLEDKARVGPWPDVVAKEAAAPRKQW